MAALRSSSDDPKRYTMRLLYKSRVIEAAISVAAVAGTPTRLEVLDQLVTFG